MSYEELGLKIIPNFITEQEETDIMRHVSKGEAVGKPGRNNIFRFGSDVPYKGNIVSNSIPQFLDKLADKIVTAGLLTIKPDSITINEYHTGQNIAPHIDTVKSGKIITILSLVGGAVMRFGCGVEEIVIDFPSRQVVQMGGDIRYKWTHSIDPVKSTRYSIVFRCGTE